MNDQPTSDGYFEHYYRWALDKIIGYQVMLPLIAANFLCYKQLQRYNYINKFNFKV